MGDLISHDRTFANDAYFCLQKNFKLYVPLIKCFYLNCAWSISYHPQKITLCKLIYFQVVCIQHLLISITQKLNCRHLLSPLTDLVIGAGGGDCNISEAAAVISFTQIMHISIYQGQKIKKHKTNITKSNIIKVEQFCLKQANQVVVWKVTRKHWSPYLRIWKACVWPTRELVSWIQVPSPLPMWIRWPVNLV